ncbi:MAG: carboxypeptidase-like regulatory domain-containing protein [Candidatus Marinimicrobia bacterium]|nr:carboxypeptidase-like regulatory domain-containing protein [Candidatus Neomarinimicrobiota bacterium]MCF7829496.1 carboxypeptidase-like regulatory domain-containing protein [Candidatus Neomarinimicrobiota bacterium]MCF7880106.1 carboxypeptidase-like regulatory domain-containing protein [Candidatus Neomarinimicrobiota bacterium]
MNKIQRFRQLVISIAIILITGSTLFAASTGRITGQIVDSETGDPLIGANVILEATQSGAATDLNGNFMIRGIRPGIYTVKATYIGYEAKRITGVEVQESTTTRLDIALAPSSLQMDEVVVEVDAKQSGDVHLLTEQRNSSNVQDGISAAQMSRAGDSNAADALARVTGVSVIDGKTVQVRSLGERYTNTQMNGAPIPSPDPDKKTVPLNLFSSALLESITASKTFTPDLPGTFAGGSVNIKTKAYPDNRVFKFSLSAGNNFYGTDNIQYRQTDGGRYDFFGFDDGTRSMPASIPDTIRLGVYNGKLSESPLTRKELLGQYGADFQTGYQSVSGLPGRPISLGASYGDRFNPNGNLEYGFFSTLKFSNDYDYTVADINEYSMNNDLTMSARLGKDRAQSEYSTNLGASFSTGMELFNAHKIKFHHLYTHNSANEVTSEEGFAANFDNGMFIKHYFSEKSISTSTLSGSHQLGSPMHHRLEWSYTNATSRLSEPDTKRLNYREKQAFGAQDSTYFQMDTYSWSAGTREFLSGDDNNASLDLNWEMSLNDRFNQPYKLKLGTRIQDNNREFERRSFYHSYANKYSAGSWDPEVTVVTDGQYGAALTDSNYFSVDADGNVTPGLIIRESTQPSDAYSASEDLNAGFAMVEVPLGFGLFQPLNRVRFIGGARYETYQMNLQPYDPVTNEPYKGNISGSDTLLSNINEVELLPSYNLIVALSEKSNLRLAYSHTVARPEFREIAPFEYREFYGEEPYVGFPFLKTTDIRNYDIRYEWFPRAGELLAATLFTKDFTNPIENSLIEVADGSYRTPQNARSASSWGAEFELRTKLGFIPQDYGVFEVQFNTTYSQTEVETDSVVTLFTGYQVRNTATAISRPLQGQSDLIMNASLNYRDLQGLSATMAYNTFTKRPRSIGAGGLPNEYEYPFHSLNLTVSKNIQKFSIGFKAKNLLNSKVKFGQIEPATSELKTTKVYQPGQSISLGVSYNL